MDNVVLAPEASPLFLFLFGVGLIVAGIIIGVVLAWRAGEAKLREIRDQGVALRTAARAQMTNTLATANQKADAVEAYFEKLIDLAESKLKK